MSIERDSWGTATRFISTGVFVILISGLKAAKGDSQGMASSKDDSQGRTSLWNVG
jgi:hypothetical protein